MWSWTFFPEKLRKGRTSVWQTLSHNRLLSQEELTLKESESLLQIICLARQVDESGKIGNVGCLDNLLWFCSHNTQTFFSSNIIIIIFKIADRVLWKNCLHSPNFTSTKHQPYLLFGLTQKWLHIQPHPPHSQILNVMKRNNQTTTK